MPNPENLIPAQKGEVRNPKGRGLGTPNRSTIAKMVLEMSAEPPEKIKNYLNDVYPVLFKNQNEKQTTEMLMNLRIAMKAFLTGDVSAYTAIMDSAYGKAKETMQLGAEDITEIEIKIKKDETPISRGQEHNESIPEESEGVAGEEE